MSSPRHIRRLAAVALLGAAVAGCGGASHSNSTNATSKPSSSKSAATKPVSAEQADPASLVVLPQGAAASQAIASVGGRAVTAAEVERLMFQKNPYREPVPDAPDYSACIARQKAEAEKGLREGLPSTAPVPAVETLRQTCSERYGKRLKVGLSAAIHNRWLIGEAAEEGIHVDEAEVLAELRETERGYGSNAKLKAYLKALHQTLGELKEELRIGKLATGIFNEIEAKDHAAAASAVASYYQAHEQQFTTPEGRTLRIVRTVSAASAAKVKAELLAGKSFAAVAKELSAVGQPVTAKDGEVVDLRPGVLREPTLQQAIFAARLNHLYGPLRVVTPAKTIAPEANSGYFIFEVRAKVPAHRTPLAKVRSSIAQQLATQQKTQNLAAFVKAFRSRWKSRTDCHAGYAIVNYCRGYKPKASEPEDPYTL